MKETNPNLDYYTYALHKDEAVENITTPPAAPQAPQSSPAPNPQPTNELAAQREKIARKDLSRICASITVMLVVWIIANLLISSFAYDMNQELVYNPTFVILSSTLPLIFIAIPVAYFVLKDMPTVTPEVQPPLGGAKFVLLLFISMGIMIAGNLISNVAMSFVGEITGTSPINTLEVVMDAPIWVVVLCTVILSPIFEEILCRGLILRRLLPYGEVTAIVFSSVIFAFIHNNLFQFVYAFGIGIVLSLVYLRTGRLRYCALLHICINALGSLFSVIFLSQMDIEFVKILTEGANSAANDPAFLEMIFDNIVPLMLMGLYTMTQYAMAFAGLILLLLFWKKVKIVRKETDLPASRSLTLAATSVGGILLIIISIFLTMLNMGFVGA